MKKYYSISLTTSVKTLVLSFLALSFVALSGCGIMDAAAKLQEYNLEGDKIPTINSQVGQRKVIRVETAETQKQYTYKSDTVFEDLLQYTLYLRENGWTVIQDYNLEDMPGNGQLAKASSDEGKILIVAFAYEEEKYAIKVTKIEGTLTFYE